MIPLIPSDVGQSLWIGAAASGFKYAGWEIEFTECGELFRADVDATFGGATEAVMRLGVLADDSASTMPAKMAMKAMPVTHPLALRPTGARDARIAIARGWHRALLNGLALGSNDILGGSQPLVARSMRLHDDVLADPAGTSGQPGPAPGIWPGIAGDSLPPLWDRDITVWENLVDRIGSAGNSHHAHRADLAGCIGRSVWASPFLDGEGAALAKRPC